MSETSGGSCRRRLSAAMGSALVAGVVLLAAVPLDDVTSQVAHAATATTTYTCGPPGGNQVDVSLTFESDLPATATVGDSLPSRPVTLSLSFTAGELPSFITSIGANASTELPLSDGRSLAMTVSADEVPVVAASPTVIVASGSLGAATLDSEGSLIVSTPSSLPLVLPANSDTQTVSLQCTTAQAATLATIVVNPPVPTTDPTTTVQPSTTTVPATTGVSTTSVTAPGPTTTVPTTSASTPPNSTLGTTATTATTVPATTGADSPTSVGTGGGHGADALPRTGSGIGSTVAGLGAAFTALGVALLAAVRGSRPPVR